MNSYFEDRHLDFVLKHYRQGIFNTQKALAQFKQAHFSQDARRHHAQARWRYALSGLAASLLLAAGLWQYHRYVHATIQLTAENGTATYILPDRTQVTLSEGSILSYPENRFGRKRRPVSMSGKIYFEVAKNPEKPFEIHSRKGFVRVLGTEFQVEEKEHSTEIYVTEGKVLFARAEDMEGKVLTGGMQAEMDFTSAVPTVREEADPNVTAWQRRTFIFENTPVDKVLSTLSGFYHIQLDYDGEPGNLTGEFDTGNAYEIIPLIEKALGVDIYEK